MGCLLSRQGYILVSVTNIHVRESNLIAALIYKYTCILNIGMVQGSMGYEPMVYKQIASTLDT